MKNSIYLVIALFFCSLAGRAQFIPPPALKTMQGDYQCADLPSPLLLPIETYENRLPFSPVNYFKGRDGVVFKAPSDAGQSNKILPCANRSVVIKADPNIIPYIMNYEVGNSPPDYDYYDLGASYELDQTKVVGFLPGSASVSPSGAPVYSLPIDVLPGTNGMQPQLSIVYNGQSGRGLLGWGMELAGLSAIYRTAPTLYHDGQLKPLDYSATDRFILDGRRMIATSGTYGSAGSKYALELDDFSSTEAFGTNPDHFICTSKDGKKIEFGNTVDSRFTAAGTGSVKPFMWLVNKVEDENGNYMAFEYISNNGESLISKIRYTGNTVNGRQPYNEIRFKYTNTTNENTQYVATDSYVRRRALLLAIDMMYEGEVVRSYTMTYDYRQNEPFLTSVKLKGRDNLSLNPTSFQWNVKDGGFVQYNNFKDHLARGSYPFPNVQNTGAGDLNGDGILDVAVVADNKFNVLLGLAGETYTTAILDRDNSISNNSIERFRIENLWVMDTDNDGISEIITLEIKYVNGFSADGKFYFKKYKLTGNQAGYGLEESDLVAPFIMGAYVLGHYSVDGVNRKYIYPVSGDFDGNGTTDVVFFRVVKNASGDCDDARNNSEICSWDYFDPLFGIGIDIAPLFNLPNFSRNFTCDLDGDGVTEFLTLKIENIYKNNYIQGIEIDKLTSSGLQRQTGYSNYAPLSDNKMLMPVFGDFNGDGKQDLFGYYYLSELGGYKGYTPKMYINTGGKLEFNNTFSNDLQNIFPKDGDASSPDNWDDWRPWPGPNMPAAFKMYTGDFNGDGKSDILYVRSNPNVTPGLYDKYIFTICYSTGSGFIKEEQAVVIDDFDTKNFIISDFNKDGRSDIFVIDKNGTTILFYMNKSSKNPYLLQTVKNGFDSKTTFNYRKGIVDGTFYTQSSGALSSKLLRSAPIWLVSGIESPGGSTNTSTSLTTYQYEDGIAHKEGKGFLCFKKVTSTDAFGTKIISTNEVNPTYFHPYSTGSETYKGSSLVSSSSTANTFVDRTNKRFYNYLSSSTVTNQLENTVTTNVQTMDEAKGELTGQSSANGSDGTSTTTYQWGAVGSTVATRRITSASNTITRKGEGTASTSFSYTTSYTYDARSRIKTEVQFDGKAKAITTTYNYNDFGNAIETIVSAAGETSRSAKISYDGTGRFATMATNALNIVESKAEYDGRWGVPLRTWDKNGKMTEMEYNGMGMLKATTLPTGLKITYTTGWSIDNTKNTQYVTVTDAPYAPLKRTYYDAFTRTVKEEQETPNGISFTENTYDQLGRISTSTYPRFASGPKRTITRTYDGYNRILKINDAIKGVTDYTYTPGQRKYEMEVVTDVSSVKTKFTYEYDAYGSMIKETDVRGTVEKFYHATGNISKIKSFGRDAFTYTYDPSYGVQTNINNPNEGASSVQYNGFFEVSSVTDAKHTTTYAYDQLGRLTQKTTGEGTTNYNYNGTGTDGVLQLSNITGPYANTSIDYVYDSFGRTRSVTENIRGKTFVTGYEYDTYGNLAKAKYPNNFDVNYVYDADKGHVLSMNSSKVAGNLWTFGSTDAMNRLTTFTNGNGQVTNYTYDANLQLSRIHVVKASQIVMDHRYLFNAQTGNLTERSDFAFGRNLTETFSYYDQGWLKDIKKGAATTNSLTYDTWGNLTAKTDAGSSFSFNAGNDKLSNVNDPSANIRTITQRITYNSVQDLESIVEGTVKKQFVYGADGGLGRIEHATVDAATQAVTLNRAMYYVGDFEQEVDAAGSVTKQYTYIQTPGGTTAVWIEGAGGTNGQMYYIHTDHLGSVAAITDQSGYVTQEFSYDAWGRRRNVNTWTALTPDQLTTAAASQLIPYGYTFKEHFDELGLVYFGARVYDPVLGRWNAPDPMAAMYYDMSPYHFAGNNPLRYVDINGMQYNDFIDDIGKWWHGSGMGQWVMRNEASIIRGVGYTAAIVAGVGLSFLPGGAIAGAIVAGAIIGATEGYLIAKQSGASGWRMVAYVAGGAAIGAAAGLGGALVGGAAAAAVSAGGGTALEVAIAAGAAGGGVGGFVQGLGMTALGGGNFSQSLQAGLIGMGTGIVVGGAAGAAGYGIGKAFPGRVKVSQGGDGGAMEAGATTQNGGGTATTAPKVQGTTWVDNVGYVFDDFVVKGSTFALVATRTAVSMASVVSAGMLSIMTAIPGDTPARLRYQVNSAQDKKLSPDDIAKLQRNGFDPEALKGGRSTGQTDLYKNPNGDIVIKPKTNQKVPGEPTGLNLRDLK